MAPLQVRRSVFPFKPKCRIAHRENYSFLSSKNYFLDQSIQKVSILFDLEKGSTGADTTMFKTRLLRLYSMQSCLEAGHSINIIIGASFFKKKKKKKMDTLIQKIFF